MDRFLIKALRTYFRSGLRGSTRLIEFLSHRYSKLQSIPIHTKMGAVYADLRSVDYRGLLTVNESTTDEEIVMRRFIRKGNVAFDIGVYTGLYTALMSELVGPTGAIHSFEPNQNMLPCLRRTVTSLGNVTLHEHALSDREGEATFFIPKGDASMSSLVDWTGSESGGVETIACRMERLDRLFELGVIPEPDFIKCDVEGAEIEVFRGGKQLLNRRIAPVVFFEVNPRATKAFGHEPDCCLEFLRTLSEAQYRLFQVVDESLQPVGRFEDLKFNVHGFTNAVAVPASRSV